MVKTTEERHQLMTRYEDEFEARPMRFKAKVFWLVALGYAFFFVVLLVNLALPALLLRYQMTSGFHWALGAGYAALALLAITTIRSLFVRLPPPVGLTIERDTFPYLYDLVDSLRKPMRLHRKPIRLILDWDYDAFATTRPLFGLFGPSDYYLGVGLPLIASLNGDHLKAILAHKLAPLSRKHTRITGKLIEVTILWEVLVARLNQRSFLSFPYRTFANWYFRYLNAARIAIGKSQKLEADCLALRAVEKEAIARALLRVELRARLVVADYWDFLWGKCTTVEDPSAKALSRLFDRLATTIAPEAAAHEIRWRLGDIAMPWDEHPSLRDRLTALEIDLPENEEQIPHFVALWNLTRPESCYQRVSSGQTIEINQELDVIWQDHSAEAWKLAHESAKPGAAAMRRLEMEWKEKGSLGPEKAWKYAALAINFRGLKQAVPVLEYALEQKPHHPHANFHYGSHLVEQLDPEAVDYLKKAIELDPLNYHRDGLALLSNIQRRLGHVAASSESSTKAAEGNDKLELAIKEREKPVKSRDEFLRHEMDEVDLEELRDAFAEVSEIKRVSLARKKMEHMPKSPYYVFILKPTLAGRFKFRSLQKELFEPFGFSRAQIVFPSTWRTLPLRLKILKVDGAVIYRKGKK